MPPASSVSRPSWRSASCRAASSAQVADAGDRGLAFTVEQAGYGLEIVACECELTGAVNLWNARENLFDQGRTRPGKPDDENGPLCVEPGAGEPLKEAPIECMDQPGDELFVLVRPIASFPSIKLDACQAVGLSGNFGGPRIRAASVEDAGETEEQVDPAQVRFVGAGQVLFDQLDIRVRQAAAQQQGQPPQRRRRACSSESAARNDFSAAAKSPRFSWIPPRFTCAIAKSGRRERVVFKWFADSSRRPDSCSSHPSALWVAASLGSISSIPHNS